MPLLSINHDWYASHALQLPVVIHQELGVATSSLGTNGEVMTPRRAQWRGRVRSISGAAARVSAVARPNEDPRKDQERPR
eukprot:CAMPEP_0113565956 /NCGR_PEP_ID=MMETSP0015_2-20120614/22458_1 /TAXON_ID=2838 /ORGANISM="Odontella" /LENGTH=79 /DNA_ID=CAMNT_0000468197 /DNA_START=89 /DNA_END=328 /DNA_ORIENTATION=+ /assembly_acc=CAM_ASM_000160